MISRHGQTLSQPPSDQAHRSDQSAQSQPTTQRRLDFDASEPDAMLREVEALNSHDKLRGFHSAILELCNLRHLDRRDKSGKAVSSSVLKNVLVRIQGSARSRGPARCSIKTIADECNIGGSTVFRALQVLERLGHIIRGKDASRRGLLGAPLTEYTLVWSELSLLCDRDKLAKRTGSNQRPTSSNQRTTRSDQRATGSDQSPTRSDQGLPSETQEAAGSSGSSSKKRRLDDRRRVSLS
jgi:hypothetical protein